MHTASESALPEAVRDSAHPLTDAARDYDPLLKRIGDARFAPLGVERHLIPAEARGAER